MKLSDAIKKMIKDNNLSQQRLAEKLGLVRQQSIGNAIAKGNMKVSFLYEICEAMDYDIIIKPRGNGRESIKLTDMEGFEDNRGAWHSK